MDSSFASLISSNSVHNLTGTIKGKKRKIRIKRRKKSNSNSVSRDEPPRLSQKVHRSDKDIPKIQNVKDQLVKESAVKDYIPEDKPVLKKEIEKPKKEEKLSNIEEKKKLAVVEKRRDEELAKNIKRIVKEDSESKINSDLIVVNSCRNSQKGELSKKQKQLEGMKPIKAIRTNSFGSNSFHENERVTENIEIRANIMSGESNRNKVVVYRNK